MEYLNLTAIFSGYSAQAVIIALISSAIYKMLDKLSKGKLPVSFKVYLPILISLLLNVIYEIAFVTKGFWLSADFINKCLLCCSFSSIMGAGLDRLIKNKPILSPSQLLIEGLIKDVCKPENLQACINLIEKIVLSEISEQDKIKNVSQILSEHCVQNIEQFNFTAISIEIVKTYLTIEDTKTK